MEPVWMNRAVRGWTTLTAGKVLDLLAAALALQGLGDVIPFQAGCRPLELPCLILKHLSLKKAYEKPSASPDPGDALLSPCPPCPEHLPFHLPFFSVRSTLEAGSILHSECGR